MGCALLTAMYSARIQSVGVVGGTPRLRRREKEKSDGGWENASDVDYCCCCGFRGANLV